MQIELKGRHVQINDELREHVERRFRKIAAQVSDLARLEVELCEEHAREKDRRQVAKATLWLKGATLHAEDHSEDLRHAIHLCEEELSRQVKRHRDKRRKRREAHHSAPSYGVSPAA